MQTLSAAFAGILTLVTGATSETLITSNTLQPSHQKVQQRYIIQLTTPANSKLRHTSSDLFNIRQVIQQSHGRVLKSLPGVHAVVAELTQQQARQLTSLPGVARVELDPIRYLQAETPSWGIDVVQAHEVSDALTGNIKVCIADTGYELDHDDLPGGSSVTGEVVDLPEGNPDLGDWFNDAYGHGSHIAGTIAAIGGNNQGVAGINPSGAINLHVVKIVDNPNAWTLYGSDLIEAVNRCVDAGANIINLSISGPDASAAEEEAMNHALQQGALIIGAGGNRGSTTRYYPAGYDSVVAVNAVDEQLNSWRYNHNNTDTLLSAPGVDIRSTVQNNGYANWTGTSVATAFVSGVAGLVWSHYPDCSANQIRHILAASAVDQGAPGKDNLYGFGVVNAVSAMNYAANNECEPAAPYEPVTTDLSWLVPMLYINLMI